MAALPDCPHMPRKCAHYDPNRCKDPASRKCHYVQNTINSAVAVRSVLTLQPGLREFPATSAYLQEIEAFLIEMGL